MLVMAGEVCDIPDISNLVVYNFTSLNESYQRWNILPNIDVRMSETKDYDFMFSNYIFLNNDVFIEFFNMMYAYYLGSNIYILISRDFSDSVDNVNESLFKLIQQRYGINVFEIRSSDDVFHLNESLCNMNINGVYNFDQDKERYVTLLMQKELDLIGPDAMMKKYGGHELNG